MVFRMRRTHSDLSVFRFMFLLRHHVLKICAAQKKLGIRRAHSVIGDSPITEWMWGESRLSPPPLLSESSRFFIHSACLGFSFPYCCLTWRARWKNSQICWIYFVSLWVNHQEKMEIATLWNFQSEPIMFFFCWQLSKSAGVKASWWFRRNTRQATLKRWGLAKVFPKYFRSDVNAFSSQENPSFFW